MTRASTSAADRSFLAAGSACPRRFHDLEDLGGGRGCERRIGRGGFSQILGVSTLDRPPGEPFEIDPGKAA